MPPSGGGAPGRPHLAFRTLPLTLLPSGWVPGGLCFCSFAFPASTSVRKALLPSGRYLQRPPLSVQTPLLTPRSIPLARSLLSPYVWRTAAGALEGSSCACMRFPSPLVYAHRFLRTLRRPPPPAASRWARDSPSLCRALAPHSSPSFLPSRSYLLHLPCTFVLFWTSLSLLRAWLALPDVRWFSVP